MRVEKLDVVAVDVKNLDEAIKLFSDILGVTFVKFPEDLKIERLRPNTESVPVLELSKKSPWTHPDF